VAQKLLAQGVEVVMYDPEAMPNARRTFPELTFAESASAACAGADLVLHVTEWEEFRDLDPVSLGTTVRRRQVLDARNCLSTDAWRAAGWDYRSFGRS
jgi:UDPglucose 6-dehydrogenase